MHISWRCCLASTLPRCSAGAGSLLVPVMVWTSARADNAMWSPPQRRRTATDPALLQRARIRGAATWADRSGACGSWPVQLFRRRLILRLRAHLLSGAPYIWASLSAGPSRVTTGAQTGSTPAICWPEPGVELGHYLSPHHRPRDLAQPLSSDGRVESQSGGLGCRGA